VFYASFVGVLAKYFGIEGLAPPAGSTFLVTGILIAVLGLGFLWFVVKAAIASVAMAAVSWLTLHFFQSVFDFGNTLLRLGIVFLVLIVSATTFLCVARLLKLSEAEHILKAAVDLLPWTRCVPAQ
jgi:peptidoglycan biosynthesis protein MviN/MurJ (putative lipid II flippase)